MKHLVFIFLGWLLLPTFAVAQQELREWLVTGAYQGENIYLQNPLSISPDTYCIQAIYVNDVRVLEEPAASALEVDLSQLHPNELVIVRVKHRANCQPRLINPRAVAVDLPFSWGNFTANDSTFRWIIQGGVDEGQFIVEQEAGGNWQQVRAISRLSKERPYYTARYEAHPGLNNLRVRYESPDGYISYSPVYKFISERARVTFYPTQVTDKIYLSREADYHIEDNMGNEVTRGSGEEINLRKLRAGKYYLVIGDQRETFVKK